VDGRVVVVPHESPVAAGADAGGLAAVRDELLAVRIDELVRGTPERVRAGYELVGGSGAGGGQAHREAPITYHA